MIPDAIITSRTAARARHIATSGIVAIRARGAWIICPSRTSQQAQAHQASKDDDRPLGCNTCPACVHDGRPHVHFLQFDLTVSMIRRSRQQLRYQHRKSKHTGCTCTPVVQGMFANAGVFTTASHAQVEHDAHGNADRRAEGRNAGRTGIGDSASAHQVPPLV